MSLSITVEPMIGDSLYDTLEDAWALGRKLDLCVGFKFNDGSVFCYPDGWAHMSLPKGLDQFRRVGGSRGMAAEVERREYRGGEHGTWTEWRRMER